MISMDFEDISIFTDQKTTYNVKEFVESCLVEETQSAVKQIGLKGGWLYAKPIIYATRGSHKFQNRIAEGFDYLERVEMPYWYFYDEGDEKFKTNIPEYESDSPFSIKNQLKRYLDENLEKNCIQSFRNFEDVYSVVYDPSEIDTEVIFQDRQILVTLNLPLEISEINSENSDFIDIFKYKQPNYIFVPYHLAKDTIYGEIGHSFIEKRIMQFLGPYQSSGTRKLLPPQYDFRMKYDFTPWQVPKVEKLAKSIISSEIGKIQFLNTDYKYQELEPELQDSEFAKKFNSMYVKDYLSEFSRIKDEDISLFRKFKDYRITPTYEVFFPTYFDIENSLGGAVLLPKPESVLGFLPIFFTEYVASYEMTMPIVFEIESVDETEDFVFKVPMEANIKHNVPLREQVSFDFSLEDEEQLDENDERSLTCDKTQFISDVISLNLTDEIDYGRGEFLGETNGVEDANIKFYCKDSLSVCDVGHSTINGESNGNKYSELKFRLPINCEPGRLEIKKFNHQQVDIDNVNPSIFEKINLGTYVMNSPKSMKVKVRLKSRTAGQNEYSTGRVLKEDETGFVIFEHLQTENFVRVLNINPENQYNLSIDLIPGNYSITGVLSYNKLIQIPAMAVEGAVVPPMNLTSWVAGGIELRNQEVETKFLLTRDEVSITFLDYGIPTTYQSLGEIAKEMEKVKEYSFKLRFED